MASPICPDCRRYHYHLKKCRYHPSNVRDQAPAKGAETEDELHPEFAALPDVGQRFPEGEWGGY
ncbi:hypothetical protein RE428_32040 [Marinobacter nanhaiticus D15-8W]|uniref:Uncharacterized protein n=1 Tax=Marinobacter nanhaiticus D15-8W TaxID=626887 RepID=N6X0C5_9GAMM|nr:hypothetical protein J057_01795 [Marinobacter nanhaiticus D15-8W]BES72186.1 hypothetical protein RE428_32040 [Marinobacter nanhaiticus D15-8W]